MKRVQRKMRLLLMLFCTGLSAIAQETADANTRAVVPPLIKFSGTLSDGSGKPLTGVVGATFALYEDEQGGAPLWLETQNVQPDSRGHYTVMLGSTSSTGLPSDIFVAGEARWLAVQPQGQEEQARVLLLSVPYALKAGDAETLGGKPASAYALAGAPVVLAAGTSGQATPGTAGADSGSGVPMTTCASVTSDGTAVANTVALFTSPCNVEGSVITQSSGDVGIGGAGHTLSKLYLTDTQSNFGSRWLQNNVFNTSATTNGSNEGVGLDANLTNMTIAAGVTDGGYRLAVRGEGQASSSSFAGTLAEQMGVAGYAGIAEAASGAQVENATAGQFHIYNKQAGTTITNAYGVYIYNADTTGTITNRYDLYASSANANNYFAGKVGVGTATPAANLEVNGTAKFDGLATFATGQTFPGAGTITGVTAGTNLTGGGTTGIVTLNVDTTKIPQLAGSNTFNGTEVISGANSSGVLQVTNTITSGAAPAVNGTTDSTGGSGIRGNAVAATGTSSGVIGVSASPNGEGVAGLNTAAGGYGVVGNSTGGQAVVGYDSAKSGASVGVYGTTSSSNGYGVEGTSPYAGVYGSGGTGLGTGIGVEGVGNQTGVYGNADGPSLAIEVGVYGTTNGSYGVSSGGVEGVATGTDSSGGLFFGGPTAVSGGAGIQATGGADTTSTGVGGGAGGIFYGGSSVNGIGGTGGIFQGGSSPKGLEGNGVIGEAAASSVGVYGVAGDPSNEGKLVQAGEGAGVWGDTDGMPQDATTAAVVGTTDYNNAAAFFNNTSAYGATLYVENDTAKAGGTLFEGTIYGLYGKSGGNTMIGDPGCDESSGNMAIQLGQSGMNGCLNYTLLGNNAGSTYINAYTGQAVHLRVNNTDVMEVTSSGVSITGTMSATGTKSFKIDHPLDPANKYLLHAAIESSEVLNLYTGNAILDDSGTAVVQLPDWFEAINKDFRYQLTAIGAPARDLYIAEEISGGRFKIAGGKPGGKVSWQVTGVRNDAWVKAYPMEVEEDKGADRGHYLTPELYGAPVTARIGYEAPPPASEQVVHRRPIRPRRGNATPVQQLPLVRPVPLRPVVPSVPPLPLRIVQASTPAVNQK